MKYECNCGEILESTESDPVAVVAYYHWKNGCEDVPIAYLEMASGRSIE